MSSSGSDGSAERTMLASRWHSPPKPWSVLSWVTGMCWSASRSASREPCHVAFEHARPHAVEPGQRRLEQRRLARPRRAHQVDAPSRPRGRSRRGWRDAIVLLASSASSTTLTLTRCMRCPPRPRSNRPPARRRPATSPVARSTPGSGTWQLRLPLVRARLAAQPHRHHHLLEPRALARACRATRSRSRTRASPG